MKVTNAIRTAFAGSEEVHDGSVPISELVQQGLLALRSKGKAGDIFELTRAGELEALKWVESDRT